MNIPNKNELTRIYGEAEKSAARFRQSLITSQKFTIMIQQNFSQRLEEQRLSETTQTITAAA